MKKYIVVAIMAALMLLTLSACGGSSGDARCTDAVNAVKEKDLATAMDSVVSYGEETYEDNFERLYNFPLEDVEDGAIAFSSGGGEADEISIVKASDPNGTTEIRKYMEARLEQRLHDFQNYMPDEVSKIENGRIVVQQQYVFLVISDRADDIVTTLREALSE